MNSVPESDLTRISLTAAVWIAWCLVHSLLNCDRLRDYLHEHAPRIARAYRLIYNVIAVVTLIAAWNLTPREGDFIVWRWDGALIVIPVIAWIATIAVFAMTFRELEGQDFLGIRGLLGKQSNEGKHQTLVTWGIYGVVRHPQFAVGIVALWMRTLRQTDLVINTVLSLYLIFGAYIEEMRLIDFFGREYKRYRREVPRLVPRRVPSFRELVHGSKTNS